VQLQPRDMAILADLGEYGLLDTATIAARHWPGVSSPRACQERLRSLCDAKLIHKTQLLVARVGRMGSRIPAVYALMPHGAEVLELETGEVPPRIARSEPSPATLLHRLEMIQTRVAFDDACRSEAVPLPTWIYEQDTYTGVRISDPLERRHRLYERIRWNGHDVACRPDAACLLRLPSPHQPNTSDDLLVYWEIDRSTNSRNREAKKAAGYEALIGSRRFATHWPDASDRAIVRVFYVCPSEERIANIAAEIAPTPVATYYRFACYDALSPASILTQAVWRDTEGRRYAILNNHCRTADNSHLPGQAVR
jgi:hypothetical protein